MDRTFKSTTTSLFTSSTCYSNLNNFHEYLIQVNTLKSRGTKDHFRRVNVLDINSYLKACMDGRPSHYHWLKQA
jgi:hypothetical protein